MSFNVHGKTTTYWQDNILIVKPSGAFNEEGMIAALQQIQELIQQRPVNIWARVNVFENNETVGPLKSLSTAFSSVQYGMEHGCRLFGLIGGSHINKHSYEIICTQLNLPLYCFENLHEAKVFVAQSDVMKSSQSEK